jgi:hypothetical protein
MVAFHHPIEHKLINILNLDILFKHFQMFVMLEEIPYNSSSLIHFFYGIFH